jgi:hypothetical protein
MKTTTLRKGVLVVLATLPWTVCAHEQETGAIQEKLESKYQLTTIKDDQSDTVRTGSRLILRKGNLVMFAATSGNLCANTYRESEIRPSGACKAAKTSNSAIKLVSGIGKHIPHADKVPATQTFGKGDQFWVTKIEVTDAGMTFDLFSDAISDVHYKGALTIPCKSPMPAPDEALKVVAEVFEVVPAAEDAGKGSDQPPSAQSEQQEASAASQPAAPTPAAQPTAEPAPAPIAPPPPPPTEVSEGQTIDQVIAALGEPVAKLSVGNKVIYTYKNLKVTFVNGKVKDFE